MGSTKVKMVETLDVDTSVKKEKELEREPWGAAKFEGSEKGQRNGRGGVRVLWELCPGSHGILRKKGVTA